MFKTFGLNSGLPRENALPSATGTVRSAGDVAQGLFLRKALVLSSAVASAFLCSSPALASFEYVTHWGRYDTSGANAAFNGPTDVAFLKSNGNLLIVDSNAGVTGGGEVVIQQADGTYVTKVASVNDQGPVRAAMDPNSGDVYIGTYYESRIRHYTEAGGALTLADTWTGCTANGGNGPYTWGKTFGVAVDSTGAIYVNDYDGLRIIKMNTSGQCLAAPLTTYTKNGAPGQVFLNLTGIAVDSADNVWATDYGKKVLVKYNSAGVWQTTLTGFSNCGTTTAFDSPKDIDIDTTTNDMFITDSTHGIIKLDSSGNFLTKATKYNTNTSFAVPFGGGFTSGFYYATDYGHSAVVKYQNPIRKLAVTAGANGTVAANVGGLITGTTGGNTCTDQYVDATTVVLTATPASGYTVTWGGDGAACSGNTCTLNNINANKAVTASFSLAVAPNPLNPSTMTINGTSEASDAMYPGTYASPVTNPVHFTFSFPGCTNGELTLAMSAPALGLPWSYLDSNLHWQPLPATLDQITPFVPRFADNGTQQELYNGYLPPGIYDFFLVCDSRNGHLDTQNMATGPALTGMYVHRRLMVY